jgi:hypothetical protein
VDKRRSAICDTRVRCRPHERWPQTPVDVSDFIIYETTHKNLIRVSYCSSQSDNVMTFRMCPPTPTYSLADRSGNEFHALRVILPWRIFRRDFYQSFREVDCLSQILSGKLNDPVFEFNFNCLAFTSHDIGRNISGRNFHRLLRLAKRRKVGFTFERNLRTPFLIRRSSILTVVRCGRAQMPTT